MSTSKHIDKICIAVIAVTLVITILFMCGGSIGLTAAASSFKYEKSIFDNSYVHTIDIVMNDWDSFIETCENEEYASCTVVIDGEKHTNIAIRAKGNTSLSSVSSMGSERYSFKLEFDHYEDAKTLDGLDKLCLNNLIQDNTMMKDYIVYTMMNDFGVDSPLCSFAYLTVNGEDWGLYLAVESVEDSFLQRNYGSDTGELYKPDSLSFGGGRGNGKDFDMGDLDFDFSDFDTSGFDPSSVGGFTSGGVSADSMAAGTGNMPQMPQGGSMPDMSNFDGEMPSMPDGEMPDMSNFSGEIPSMPDGEMPDMSDFDGEMPSMPDGEMPDMSNFDGEMPSMPDGEMPDMSNFGGGGNMGGGMGSDDVKLKYIDDDPDSYSNIFDNAKTDITDADKERLIKSLKSLSEYTDLEDVLDIDEVLRYFVVHNFVCNGDSYTGSMIHNYYLNENDGQLSMIPWDYNLAFGTFQGGNASGTVNTSIDSPVSGGSVDDRPMVGWIFSDETYTEMYHELFSEFISEWFSSGKLQQMISDTAEMIRPYVEKDPTKFCTTEEFDTGVTALTEFVTLRAEAVSRQLNGDATAVDTGDLNLSDMGSMGSTMGGGNMGGGKSSDTESKSSDSEASGEKSGSRGGMQTPPSADFSGISVSQTGFSGSDGLILLGVSVLVLAIGIIIAAKKK